ncbi:hypothetical protein DERF_006633 [Dermatophagoides farinae]|uniref:Uncharacterized protein n=1 Tax=Dermatophagoides farinae TaxID=6954 RepID=A0A922HWA4_DERFA|nr:hypothetical protein DERF_006633 [Dermatophagoides farinae]
MFIIIILFIYGDDHERFGSLIFIANPLSLSFNIYRKKSHRHLILTLFSVPVNQTFVVRDFVTLVCLIILFFYFLGSKSTLGALLANHLFSVQSRLSSQSKTLIVSTKQ